MLWNLLDLQCVLYLSWVGLLRIALMVSLFFSFSILNHAIWISLEDHLVYSLIVHLLNTSFKLTNPSTFSHCHY